MSMLTAADIREGHYEVGAVPGGWGVWFVRADGSRRRVSSPNLPVRQTREEAEADLERWKRERGEAC